MRRLTVLLPVLAVFMLIFGRPAHAPSSAGASNAYDTTDISLERLVVFEAFLRPG